MQFFPTGSAVYAYPNFGQNVVQLAPVLVPISSLATPPWMSVSPTNVAPTTTVIATTPLTQYVAPEQRGIVRLEDLERRCLSVEDLERGLEQRPAEQTSTSGIVFGSNQLPRDPAILLSGAPAGTFKESYSETEENRKKDAYNAVLQQIKTIFDAPGKSEQRGIKADTLKTVLENFPEYALIRQSTADTTAPVGSNMSLDLVAFVEWLRKILPEGYTVESTRPYTVRRTTSKLPQSTKSHETPVKKGSSSSKENAASPKRNQQNSPRQNQRSPKKDNRNSSSGGNGKNNKAQRNNTTQAKPTYVQKDKITGGNQQQAASNKQSNNKPAPKGKKDEGKRKWVIKEPSAAAADAPAASS